MRQPSAVQSRVMCTKERCAAAAQHSLVPCCCVIAGRAQRHWRTGRPHVSSNAGPTALFCASSSRWAGSSMRGVWHCCACGWRHHSSRHRSSLVRIGGIAHERSICCPSFLAASTRQSRLLQHLLSCANVSVVAAVKCAGALRPICSPASELVGGW